MVFFSRTPSQSKQRHNLVAEGSVFPAPAVVVHALCRGKGARLVALLVVSI